MSFLQSCYLLRGMHVRETGKNDGQVVRGDRTDSDKVPALCGITDADRNHAHVRKGDNLVEDFLIV